MNDMNKRTMDIHVEKQITITIKTQPTWSRKEALIKEFSKDDGEVEEIELEKGYLINFLYNSPISLRYPDNKGEIMNRAKAAIEAGDKADEDYDKKRERLAKEFVPVERIAPIEKKVVESHCPASYLTAMDKAIDDYLGLHKRYLKEKEYSLSASYGSDANELIKFRNHLVKGEFTKARKVASNMDTACREAIPNNVYEHIRPW